MEPDLSAALLGAATAVVGAAVAAVAGLQAERFRKRLGSGESPRARTARLSRALTEAIDVIEEFRSEISQGQRAAAQLQQDIEQYEEIARLKRDDVEAVAQVLRSELRVESGRSFRRDLLMNGGFLLLGGGLSLLLTTLIG